MPSETPPSARPRLTPPVADVRRAVRGSLGVDGGERMPDGALVLVALSGGADSLALAAATAFEAPRAGLTAGAVIVDHGLQDDSAEVAERAADAARALGLAPVVVRRVRVDAGGGPEAAARTARYDALEATAREQGAAAVLLGHTLDDQAETVLLGLARGSGAASLQGMPARTDLPSGPGAGASGAVLLRPLLGIRRATTRQACEDAGLTPWDDPHNTDPAYARVRVRERVLPVLEAELGPGIAEALARTAEQLREDEAALSHQIDEFIEEIVEPAEAGIAVSVAALAASPAAIRQRIIRLVASSEFGIQLSRAQTLEVARLVTDWHGQGPLDLPRGVRVTRARGHLVFSTTGSTEILPHDH